MGLVRPFLPPTADVRCKIQSPEPFCRTAFEEGLARGIVAQYSGSGHPRSRSRGRLRFVNLRIAAVGTENEIPYRIR